MCSLACLKAKTEEKPEQYILYYFYVKNHFANFWKIK